MAFNPTAHQKVIENRTEKYDEEASINETNI